VFASWGCEQIGWLPNPPCHQGVCAPALMGRHTAAARLYRRHWVAPDAAGRRVATSPLGTRPPRQGQCFSLGLKEGVGFYPRVNFDGERKVSPSAGSPCLRITAPPPPHQPPSALQHFDGSDHFDLRQLCLLMIEVGRRVVGPVLPRRQGSSPHSLQLALVSLE